MPDRHETLQPSPRRLRGRFREDSRDRRFPDSSLCSARRGECRCRPRGCAPGCGTAPGLRWAQGQARARRAAECRASTSARGRWRASAARRRSWCGPSGPGARRGAETGSARDRAGASRRRARVWQKRRARGFRAPSNRRRCRAPRARAPGRSRRSDAAAGRRCRRRGRSPGCPIVSARSRRWTSAAWSCRRRSLRE